MVYSEKELHIPALKLLRDNAGGLTTTGLIDQLTKDLNPTGHDVIILKNRKDSIFSQKVRNLVSHRKGGRSLQSRGFVDYDPQTGISKITNRGRKFLDEFEPILEGIESSGFGKERIKQAISKDYRDLILEDWILEGRESRAVTIHRTRSSQLRQAKISEIKQQNQGKLECTVCGFDFHVVYGMHGRDYIEIHHLEPIHLADPQGNVSQLRKALEKVVPLCSNCHRMIHKNRSQILSVEDLRQIVRHQGQI